MNLRTIHKPCARICLAATGALIVPNYTASSWELARAYQPKDLENNFNGDTRVKGKRIEHAIWKLQRVSKDPNAEYSLVYIVKSGAAAISTA